MLNENVLCHIRLFKGKFIIYKLHANFEKKLNLIHYIYTLHYYRQIVNSTLGYCRFKQVKPEKIFTKPFSFKIE